MEGEEERREGKGGKGRERQRSERLAFTSHGALQVVLPFRDFQTHGRPRRWGSWAVGSLRQRIRGCLSVSVLSGWLTVWQCDHHRNHRGHHPVRPSHLLLSGHSKASRKEEPPPPSSPHTYKYVSPPKLTTAPRAIQVHARSAAMELASLSQSLLLRRQSPQAPSPTNHTPPLARGLDAGDGPLTAAVLAVSDSARRPRPLVGWLAGEGGEEREAGELCGVLELLCSSPSLASVAPPPPPPPPPPASHSHTPAPPGLGWAVGWWLLTMAAAAAK